MDPIRATVPATEAPSWAVWQRRLIEAMDASVEPYTEAYCEADGSLIWRHETAGSPDDFYEAFFNWPLLYLIGGADDLLPRSHRHWRAVTRQLTAFGLVRDEYALREDQFHQAESDIFFYNLCLADPADEATAERACRFADLYTGHDPGVDNWDGGRRLIRCALNGSGGAALDFYGPDHSYGWSEGMSVYGLPYHDVPGVETVEDLKDPAKARAMGAAMARRMGRGDAVPNLAVVSLVTNAWLLTGEDRYRAWVLDYAGRWAERARANGGLLPDNVGLSGEVGEHMDGKWHGALYGWTWPHGFYNVQQAALLAAGAALLMTGDTSWLELPRAQQDRIFEMGETRDLRRQQMSLYHHWIGHWRGLERAGRPRHLGRPLPVRRRRLVRLAAPLPHLPGGPVEPVHGPGGLAPHRGATRPGGLRLGRRPQLPQQGGRRPRAAVAALPGRGQPRLPRAHARRQLRRGRPPPGADPRRRRAPHPPRRAPLAAREPRLDGGPGSADPGRAPVPLQRGPPALPGALLGTGSAGDLDCPRTWPPSCRSCRRSALS